MRFATVHAAFQGLCSQGRARSFKDCWFAFRDWAEARQLVDLKSAEAKGVVERVNEIDHELGSADAADARLAALSRQLELFAGEEHVPETVAAVNKWVEHLLSGNRSVPTYEG
jgi:hypothetical protein